MRTADSIWGEIPTDFVRKLPDSAVAQVRTDPQASKGNAVRCEACTPWV